MKYKLVWDNGHACGELAGVYDNEQDAENAGKDWVAEMEAADPEGKGCYEFEVVEHPNGADQRPGHTERPDFK